MSLLDFSREDGPLDYKMLALELTSTLYPYDGSGLVIVKRSRTKGDWRGSSYTGGDLGADPKSRAYRGTLRIRVRGSSERDCERRLYAEAMRRLLQSHLRGRAVVSVRWFASDARPVSPGAPPPESSFSDAYERLRRRASGHYYAETLGDPEVAAKVMVCPVETVLRIGLCGLPRTESFEDDLEALALAFGVSRIALRALLMVAKSEGRKVSV